MAKTEDAGIFGWLLESATSGDLRRAYEEFTKTAELIDRLVEWVDKRG